MADITVHLAGSSGQMSILVMPEHDLCFSAIRKRAERMLETDASKQALKIIYVDDDGDLCILSDASMSDALTFCKQGILKLQVVGDEQMGGPGLLAAERGHAFTDSESTCSEEEWEIVQVGCQDALVVASTGEVDQRTDLETESAQVCCKGASPASPVTSTVDQRSGFTRLMQVGSEDAGAAAVDTSEEKQRLPAEPSKVRPPISSGFQENNASRTLAGCTDYDEIAATTLHNISELVSLGYSKDHAELALAAEGGDVNAAATRLLCTGELFSKYDKELAMYVLAEQGGDVESALVVLRRASELTQVYQQNNVNETIQNAASKMELAIAELGLQFEKAGETVISSASKAMDGAKQSVSEVSQRAFAGLQPLRGLLSSA